MFAGRNQKNILLRGITHDKQNKICFLRVERGRGSGRGLWAGVMSVDDYI